MSTIGLGGGCHWCTEAVFQFLHGVQSVQQGFIKSRQPDDSFSEAILLQFDPETIPLSVLLEVHLRTHSSTSSQALRGKYRSAVYVADEALETQVRTALFELEANFDKKPVTQVLKLVDFKPSQERYRNYYSNGRERPFCRTYIDPKLALIRREFSEFTVT